MWILLILAIVGLIYLYKKKTENKVDLKTRGYTYASESYLSGTPLEDLEFISDGQKGEFDEGIRDFIYDMKKKQTFVQ